MMTINNLIDILNLVKTNHGDIPVMIEGYSEDRDIKKVNYDSESKSIVIVGDSKVWDKIP